MLGGRAMAAAGQVWQGLCVARVPVPAEVVRPSLSRFFDDVSPVSCLCAVRGQAKVSLVVVGSCGVGGLCVHCLSQSVDGWWECRKSCAGRGTDGGRKETNTHAQWLLACFLARSHASTTQALATHHLGQQHTHVLFINV